MKGFINELEESVLIVNTDGKIVFVNESFLNNTGYSRLEIKDDYIENYFIYNNEHEATLKNIKKNIGNTILLSIISKENLSIQFSCKICIDTFENKECIFIICKKVNDELYTKRDLKYFLDTAPFMVSIKSVNGKYVYLNYSIKRLLGYVGDEYIGKSEHDIVKWNEVNKVLEEDKYIVDSKKSKYYEKHVTFENGVSKFFDTYKTPILDEMGEVTHIVKLSKDVSFKKRIEEEVDKSYEVLTNLNNILNIENLQKCKYESLRDIQSYIVNSVGAEGSNIWVYDEKKENLVSMFRNGISAKITKEGTIIKVVYDELKNSFEGPKHIDSMGLSYKKDELKEHGIKYVYIYRIIFNNEILGVLALVFKEYKDMVQSKEEFMKTICSQMGMIIKNENLSLQVNKELKKRLEVEKELELFLETDTDLMGIIDYRGRIKKVNKECTKILGYSKEELLKMTWSDVIHPDDFSIARELFIYGQSESNNPIRNVNKAIAKDGSIVWLQWGAKFLKDKRIYIYTARDITEFKKLEEQKKLYEASIQLEKIRNEFFANISHEFKTPLNIILTTIQLINRGIEDEIVQITGKIDIKKYMKSIKQNSYRLLRLVNNLIDITRIDTGYYKLNLENVNVISIIEDITMSVAQYVEDKGISLIFDTEVEEKIIACDPDKIERIMLNLLSNAVKYTKDNGEIDVYIKVDSKNIIVSVKDNGIGIEAEKLKGIFDRFVRVDNLMTRQCEGSGIGLSLVKSLVEMHGGIIEVNSEIDKGTEFIFSIPILTVNEEVKISDINVNSRIENCIIEFSDIYK